MTSESTYQALVPHLVGQLSGALSSDNLHVSVDGSMLSADISGFTKLTEELGARGREGAELITSVVNSCFEDLIAAAESFGGDVIKFGGDAVLVFFGGPDHELRAGSAARSMQFALERNPQARRHDLRMTVGVNDGPFDVMLVGSRQRDLLIAGPNTTFVLELEAAAETGEVVASTSITERMVGEHERGGGIVIFSAMRSPLAADDRLTNASLDLDPFVPASLREHYVDYAELGAEHRLAAIGFVLVEGVDSYLATHGGPATAEVLGKLLDDVAERIEPTGVALLHSDMAPGGVKLLLGSGVPSSNGEAADALIYAALAVSRVDTPLTIRQGLNSGTVFAGFLGAQHRRTFTVMGDCVNTAARMLGVAKPGEVIAVADLVTSTRGHVLGTELEPMLVKGKTQPVHAVRVQSIESQQSGAATSAIEIVGRDSEREVLKSTLQDRGAITVVGAAGSGKTRLASEVIEGGSVLSGVGGRYMTATPYGPFWAALRAAVGIDSFADPTDAGNQLLTYVRTHNSDLATMASLFAPVFGAELVESTEAAAIDDEFRRDVVHRSITELLTSLEPAVSAVVIEDTQWLDDASTELLNHLETVGPARGWAIIRSQRGDAQPEETEPQEAEAQETADQDSGALELLLGPLPVDAVEAIIVAACPRRLTRRDLDRLIERAEGNPLFAIELGLAAAQPGAELPQTIEELIIGRIDRLPATQRSSVRLASVLGARFHHEQFRALALGSTLDLELDLREIDEIFEVHADGRVAFRQLLYREAAYASLPFARRKRLHRTIGIHLESTTEDVEPIAALLSEHFRLAEDRTRCWQYSNHAARRARRQHSPADAEVLYRRAIEFAPRGLDAADRSAAYRGLGECLIRSGSLEEAHQMLAKARNATDDDTENRALMALQALCRERQGRYADALRTYSRLLSAAEHDPVGQIAAHNGRASVYYHQGEVSRSLETANAALAIAVNENRVDDQFHAYKMLHISAEALGLPDAPAYAQKALQAARTVEALASEAAVLNNIGVSHQLAGELDEAASAYGDAREIMIRVGDRMGAAMAQMNLAEVDLDRGLTDGVAELLEESISEFEATGFTIGSTYSQGLLGRHALAIGHLERAVESLDGAASAFVSLGADGHAGDMELMLLEAHLSLGHHDQAASLLRTVQERLADNVFDNPDAAQQRIAELAERVHAAT